VFDVKPGRHGIPTEENNKQTLTACSSLRRD
jgi:hypothetical protein